MFFLVLRKVFEGKKLKPLGVLVFYTTNSSKGNFFTLEKQRNLMLLKDELTEFLISNYENYGLDKLISGMEYERTIRKNIEKFRHGEIKYIETPLGMMKGILDRISDRISDRRLQNEEIVLKAIYIQLPFIDSKWRIGHYYSIEDRESLRREVKGSCSYSDLRNLIERSFESLRQVVESNMCEEVFPKLPKFSLALKDTGNLIVPEFKLNLDAINAIVWELLLNFIKHNEAVAEDEELEFEIFVDNKDLYITRGPKKTREANCKSNKEGFKIGIKTIKRILEVVGASLETEERKDCVYFVLKNIFK